MKDKIPHEIAAAIWKILVEEAGAVDIDRELFLYHQERGCTEYRFCGTLGFGGKFWNNNGRWYVTCYSEDETPEREAVIARTNARLTAYRAKGRA